MQTKLRNFLAVIVGIVVGSLVNMAIITISGTIIAPPEGAIVTTTEGLIESMHLFEPKHFIFPFLAHAVGTFIGAMLAAWIAGSQKMHYAMGIGLLFLAGGIASAFMLPAPAWFILIDVSIAYIPMAYLAGQIAIRK